VALALYRKYRPATFAEVVGQEHVTGPLQQALTSGRINHAYLFSGPRGCGKTSSARIMARSLNCEKGPTPTPCGVCESCVSLAPDGPGSLDVIEIDAASHGGVDDARDLRERAFFAPVSSRYKVYIIDEAHMVSSQGFNALLKLVEEPPEFLVFIFATTEPDKVLPTIRSRTHHYPFRLIPPGTLRALLERICAEEGVTAEPPVYPLVVRAGNGSARDSLSVLDQLLAGAGPGGVEYANAVALLGVTDSALLDEVIDALAARDGGAVFQAVDRVVEAGHDPRRFAGDLLDRLRDLLVLNAVPDAVVKGLLDGPADQLERMQDQAKRLGVGTLSRLADIVHNGLVEMRGTTSPRLLLELVCARMLLPSVESDTAALLQRLERLERRADISNGPAAPVRQPAAGRPADAEEPTTGTAELVRETLRQRRAGGTEAAPAGQRAGSGAGEAGRPAESGGGVDESPGRSAGRGAAGSGADQPADASRGGQDPAAPAPRAASPGSAGSGSAGSGAAGSGAAGSGAAGSRAAGSGAAGSGAAGSGAAGSPAAGSGAVGSSGAGAGASAPAAGVAPPPRETGNGAVDAAAVRRVWPEVLEVIKGRQRRTHALLHSAVVSTVDGNTLVLAMSTAPLARLLSEGNNTDHIRTALREILGVEWRIKVEVEDGSLGGTSSTGASASVAPAAIREEDPRDEVSPDDPPPPRAAPADPERDAISLLKSTLGAQQMDDGQ
jgi:DNA polymerase-3 subunit gamma/tau